MSWADCWLRMARLKDGAYKFAYLWSFILDRSDACFFLSRKIHFLENPVVITGYYQAKVIITRTVSAIQPEPSASLPSTNYSYS